MESRCKECGLALIKGYPVESTVAQVPAVRRAAVLFHIANHFHSMGEVDRA